MLSKIFKTSLPVAGLVVLMALAACGGSASPPHSPSAKSLVSDMRSSFVIAQSVRIIGHIRSNRQTGTLDLSLFRSGDMKGTIKSNGLSVAVLRVAGRSYLYLSKATFR